ncbi:MAG: Uma2 family endonuclease [Chloroflexi bacterium]|nr:Uma2 family endonuclease [Chloroflexota bacterium]
MAHEARRGGAATLSVDDYLALERTTGVKHEYVLGQVYALAGASENHNRIAANVLAALLPAARTARCRVVGSDQQLQPGNDLYYYPDVQVLCDPTDDDPLIKRRPCVVVEVSSEGTEATDRREKLLVYRGISSLLLYLIVSQDRREVTVHFRDAAGTWQTRQAVGMDTIEIGCLGGHEISLDAIYQDVLRT